jgi:hypothetical protein
MNKSYKTTALTCILGLNFASTRHQTNGEQWEGVVNGGNGRLDITLVNAPLST